MSTSSSMSEPSLPPLQPPSGIEEALPPWKLEAESWIFPFWTSSSEIRSTQEATKSAGTPQGAYNPHEDVTAHVGGDVFQGGPGGWIFYRYRSSPVGPYDELIYVAGIFDSKASSTRGLRITNIYVSTEASVWNGRRNWNIPKHLARFRWTNVDEYTQTVEVSLPSDEQSAFFSATLSSSRYIPRLPINTAYFPRLPLIQPPVRPAEYAKKTREALVGTASSPEVYRACAPTFCGKFTLAYCKPVKETYGDGVSFPKATNTLGVGLYMPNVIVNFPWSKEYATTTKKNE